MTSGHIIVSLSAHGDLVALLVAAVSGFELQWERSPGLAESHGHQHLEKALQALRQNAEEKWLLR